MKIKGMDKNMQCRGFQFEVGKEYKIEHWGKPLELCSDTVFHYCNSLRQVHEHYSCNSDNRFFEIEVLGEEVTDETKCGSDHIKIVREITGEELAQMKDPSGNSTGLFNSGDINSGDFNSGNRNSGDFNSGNRNSGDFNSGYRNSGNRNSGDFNSGYRNSGYRNSGDFNSGYRNSGNRNSGDFNSGFGNKCSYSNGVFCNESDSNIRMFNKPSGMRLTEFYDSKYWDAICSAPFDLTKWVDYTHKEKEKGPEKGKIGGYLKTYTYKEAWANWWNKLTDENKEIIKQIPNFDPAVFKDITGIDVKEKDNE